MTVAKSERNAAIVTAYRGGNSLAELAWVFGCSVSNVYRIIAAADVKLDAEQRRDRIAASNRRFTQRPEYRERKRQWAREWCGTA